MKHTMKNPLTIIVILCMWMLIILPNNISASCVPAYSSCIVEMVWAFNRKSVLEYYDFSRAMQSSKMGHLISQIAITLPGSRFGVVHFGDKLKTTTVVPSLDQCYYNCQPLTSDRDLVQRAMLSIPIERGGTSPEASLTAAIRAATDPFMGWTKGKVTPSGKQIIKLIILSTDDSSYSSCSDGSNRLLGDGTDTCSREAPTTRLVERLLIEKDISLLALVTREASFKKWTEYKQSMPHSTIVKELNINKLDDVVNLIKDNIHEVLCQNPIATQSPFHVTQYPIEETIPQNNTKKNYTVVIASASAGVVALAAAGTAAYVYRSSSPEMNILEEDVQDFADDNELDRETFAVTDVGAFA